MIAYSRHLLPFYREVPTTYVAPQWVFPSFFPGFDNSSHLVRIKRSRGSQIISHHGRGELTEERRVVLVMDLGRCGMRGRLSGEIDRHVFGSRATVVRM